MTEAELLKAIHKGVRKANDMYMNWSGGYFLSECGGEAFMVANIAQCIMELEAPPTLLHLEESTKRSIRDSDSLRGRPFLCTNGQQRVDLALYNNNHQLKFAIEAKCAKFWNKHYFKDIEKLETLQLKLGKRNTGTAMQAGIFTAFIHSYSQLGEEQALKRLNARVNNWQERFRAYKFKKKSLYLYVSHSQEEYVKFLGGQNVHIGTSICAVIKQHS